MMAKDDSAAPKVLLLPLPRRDLQADPAWQFLRSGRRMPPRAGLAVHAQIQPMRGNPRMKLLAASMA